MRLTAHVLFICCVLSSAGTARANGPWTGAWDSHWRGGGARLILNQNGSAVEGTYPLYKGAVSGTVKGREYEGRWSEGARSGGFTFVLASDGKSFMGRFDSGEWWTGTRVAETANGAPAVSQDTPRDAFRTFVMAGDAALHGQLDELGKALEVVAFTPADESLLIGQKLERAQALFAAMNQTTFRIWTAPEGAGGTTEETFPLKQAGTGKTLTIVMRRGDDKKWRIVMPSADALANDTKQLLERIGGKLPPPDAHLKLRNPRDTMKTFYEGAASWDDGGAEKAISTLDLADVSEQVRAHEGELAAEYLKQILDRVSVFLPQEIPDDSATREPFVFFEHPAGKVTIAPAGEGDATRWLFTEDTIQSLRPLYAALENMPPAPGDASGARRSQSVFFVLRRYIGSVSPRLLQAAGPVELWQALGILLLALVGALAGWYVSPAALTGIERLFGFRPASADEASIAERFVWPLRLLITSALWFLGSGVLGLPDVVQQVMHATIALLAAVGGVWAGLLLVEFLSAGYHKRAETTFNNFDDMIVSFVSAAAKIALVALGGVYIADSVGIPYQGIIAGLGIGGLAVAFASRETLSNIFGAGILLADRPFRRGDKIVTADNTEGAVEHVGIRSTRIRTDDDTIVVVPNGKLVDATINNYGARRHRFVKSKLAIAYDTRPASLKAFVDALAALSETHPALVKGRTEASVWQLTPAAIEVEFQGYLKAASDEEERIARQALLLDVMALAERHGVTFAGALLTRQALRTALEAQTKK